MLAQTPVTPYVLDYFAELPMRKHSPDTPPHSPDAPHSPLRPVVEPHTGTLIRINSPRSLLAVVTTECAVRIYHTLTFKCLTILTGHTARVTDVRWSTRKPMRLVSCAMDGQVKVWDVEKVAAGCVGTEVSAVDDSGDMEEVSEVSPPCDAPVSHCKISWAVNSKCVSGGDDCQVWGLCLGLSDTVLAVGCDMTIELFDVNEVFGKRSHVKETSEVSDSSVRRKRNKKKRTPPPPLITSLTHHSDTVTSLIFLPSLSSPQPPQPPQSPRSPHPPHSPHSPHSSDLSLSGTVLVSGSDDGTAALSDVGYVVDRYRKRRHRERGGVSDHSHSVSDTPHPPHSQGETSSADLTHSETNESMSESSDEDDEIDCLLAVVPVEDCVSTITVAILHSPHSPHSLRSPYSPRSPHSPHSPDVIILVTTTTNQLLGWKLSSSEISFDSQPHCEAEIQKIVTVNDEVRYHPLLKSGDTGGYIIDQFYDNVSERLYLLAGSVNGHMLLFHVGLESFKVVARFADHRDGMTRTGHEAVIRSALMLPSLKYHPFKPPDSSELSDDNETGSMIFTVGEDGRICRWRPQSIVKAAGLCDMEGNVKVGTRGKRRAAACPY